MNQKISSHFSENDNFVLFHFVMFRNVGNNWKTEFDVIHILSNFQECLKRFQKESATFVFHTENCAFFFTKN